MQSAPIAPTAPTIVPSITNGQRMNQSVAPTSFITSTSRRRANSDSLIVLAINSTEASVSSTARTAAVIVTRLVTLSSFLVSVLWFETLPIAGSSIRVPPPGCRGVSALRIASTFDGSFGYTWNVSGSGLEDSSAYALGSCFFCCWNACLLGLEHDALDVRDREQLAMDPGVLRGRRAGLHIDVDQHAITNAVGRALGRLDDRDEDADDDHRDGDGRQCGKARRRVTPRRPQRLLEEEAEAHAA